MSKLIALHGKHGEGKYTIVDDEDYEYVNSRSWILDNGYAKTYWPKNRHVAMHRLILGFDHNKSNKRMECDHINRNKLDNRRSNLRMATVSQNQANRVCHKNKTGFKGVVFNHNRFEAYIGYQGSRLYLGRYLSAKDAALIYDKKAKELHGEFACLNFPE